MIIQGARIVRFVHGGKFRSQSYATQPDFAQIRVLRSCMRLREDQRNGRSNDLLTVIK